MHTIQEPEFLAVVNINDLLDPDIQLPDPFSHLLYRLFHLLWNENDLLLFCFSGRVQLFPDGSPLIHIGTDRNLILLNPRNLLFLFFQGVFQLPDLKGITPVDKSLQINRL